MGYIGYKILTDSVLNIQYNNEKQFESDCIELFEKQNELLEEMGFDYTDKVYKIHFFNSCFRNEYIINTSIDDAVQMLAIKDGADLVRFDNGNIGFIAYYNRNEDGFEILGEGEDDE